MEKSYYHNPETVEEYIRLTENINGGELIAKLGTFLPEKSAVLELGSGPGNDWAILSEHFNVTGSDQSVEFIKHLHARYPESSFLNLDARTLDTNLPFDAIYSNKVLHHLTDAELNQSLSRQWEILEDQGIICHSFWNGEGEDDFKGLYVNYHHEVGLKEKLEPQFEIIHLELYAEFEDNDSLFLIARKRA
ncbi:class I SAM-dependent methyltransferase [bacterium SCSIO 12741]|nr:class I SAM-dependent methyltransferase [bacterium SCSIO 12741]